MKFGKNLRPCVPNFSGPYREFILRSWRIWPKTTGGSGLKQQHLYGTINTSSLPSFIKTHQAVLEKNLKMWKVYWQTGGWTENGRRRWTENGRQDITIAQLSLRLRWAKSRQIKLMEDCKGFYTKRKCELHPFNTLIYQYVMMIYYILCLTKFHQNPSSGWEEFENVKSWQTVGKCAKL